MRGASCGEENPASARFCGDSGGALSILLPCAGCGATNTATQRFCHDCGDRLAGASFPAAALAHPEGERKQVTVLFADVQGSMDLAARMDPEEWALADAESINDELGITIFAPQIHRERALLARAAGDEAGYERSLRRAHELFLAIGAHGRATEIATLVGAS
jgi:hypothetical protein